MTIHPILVILIGAGFIFLGLFLILMLVRVPDRNPPEVYRISIPQGGDYDFKVWKDGVTSLERVR